MAKYIPSQFIIDFEETQNVDPASPTPYILNVNEDGIAATLSTGIDDVIGGDFDNGGEPYNKTWDIAGSVKAPMYYEQIGVYLKGLFGSSAPVDNTGSFTHTFSTVNCGTSMVFEGLMKDGCGAGSTLTKRYNGVFADTLGISLSPDGDYMIDYGVKGGVYRDTIKDSITPLSVDSAKTSGQTRIKNAHASIKIDGVTYSLAKDFSLNISKAVEVDKLIGGDNQANDTRAEISGSFSSLFDTDVYTKAVNSTPFAVEITMTNGTETLVIDLGEVKFTFKDEPRQYGTKYPINFDFTAYKNTGAQKALFTLTNQVSAQY